MNDTAMSPAAFYFLWILGVFALVGLLRAAVWLVTRLDPPSATASSRPASTPRPKRTTSTTTSPASAATKASDPQGAGLAKSG